MKASEPGFWHNRWKTNDVGGFHLPEANPFLVRHFKSLSLKKGGRVFLPLCGKTLDIAWLLDAGHCVAGAELSELAIQQLFERLGCVPKKSRAGNLMLYAGPNIDIFTGDIFNLSQDLLGPVDAVYDRAALVALPEEMRSRYTKHLRAISGNASQLVICYDYDQSLMEGPPFSISDAEVRRHYQDSYRLTLRESMDVPGGLKGKCAAKENTWLLAAQ